MVPIMGEIHTGGLRSAVTAPVETPAAKSFWLPDDAAKECLATRGVGRGGIGGGAVKVEDFSCMVALQALGLRTNYGDQCRWVDAVHPKMALLLVLLGGFGLTWCAYRFGYGFTGTAGAGLVALHVLLKLAAARCFIFVEGGSFERVLTGVLHRHVEGINAVFHWTMGLAVLVSLSLAAWVLLHAYVQPGWQGGVGDIDIYLGLFGLCLGPIAGFCASGITCGLFSLCVALGGYAEHFIEAFDEAVDLAIDPAAQSVSAPTTRAARLDLRPAYAAYDRLDAMVKVVCRQWVLVFYGAEVALLLADLAWLFAAHDVSQSLATGVRGWTTANILILTFCVAFSCLHGIQIVLLLWFVSMVSSGFDAIIANANQAKVRLIVPILPTGREPHRTAVATEAPQSRKGEAPASLRADASWSAQSHLIDDLEAFCAYVERCQSGFTVVGIRFTVEKAVIAALIVVGGFSAVLFRI